ncbi:hypothetical protein PROFUN_15303, partial [Planoprotostelium fungivorum]
MTEALRLLQMSSGNGAQSTRLQEKSSSPLNTIKVVLGHSALSTIDFGMVSIGKSKTLYLSLEMSKKSVTATPVMLSRIPSSFIFQQGDRILSSGDTIDVLGEEILSVRWMPAPIGKENSGIVKTSADIRWGGRFTLRLSLLGTALPPQLKQTTIKPRTTTLSQSQKSDTSDTTAQATSKLRKKWSPIKERKNKITEEILNNINPTTTMGDPLTKTMLQSHDSEEFTVFELSTTSLDQSVSSVNSLQTTMSSTLHAVEEDSEKISAVQAIQKLRERIVVPVASTTIEKVPRKEERPVRKLPAKTAAATRPLATREQKIKIEVPKVPAKKAPVPKLASAKPAAVVEPWNNSTDHFFGKWLNFSLEGKADRDFLGNGTFSRKKTPVETETMRRDSLTRDQLRRLDLQHANIVQRILCETAEGRICVRPNIKLSDTGVFNQISTLLNHYGDVWLSAAMDVCMPEEGKVPLSATLQPPIKSLRRRLFRESSSEDSKKNQCVLGKILHLVWLLDKAKTNHVVLQRGPLDTPHDVPLFKLQPAIRSSCDVAMQLHKICLLEENDIMRHLNIMGVKLTYTCGSAEQYDYNYKDKSEDLRDGVKLCKLVDQLDVDNALVSKCRLPAISRLQKVHNVEVAVEGIQRRGLREFEKKSTARLVVDGNKELTENLLYSVSTLFVPALTEHCRLTAEISRLSEKLPENHSSKGGPLFQWTRAVLSSLKSIRRDRDYTESLHDGSAFCSLIHFYCPSIMPLYRIRFESLTVVASVRTNYALLKTAVARLGGVPMLLRVQDMINERTDDKAVHLFLAYLSHRLLSIQNESTAALLIQKNWTATQLVRRPRKYKPNPAFLRFKAGVDRLQAVFRAKIQTNLFARLKTGVKMAQRLFRGVMARRQVSKLKAAEMMKSLLLAYVERKRYQAVLQSRSEAAIIIQTAVRGHQVRRWHETLRRSTTVLQAAWRGRCERREFSRKIQSIVRAQALVRGGQVRQRVQRLTTMAIILQSAVRGRQARLDLQRAESAATTLQSLWRSLTQRRRFFREISHVTRCQAIVRSWSVRRRIALESANAIHIQRVWRGHVTRKSVRESHRAAVMIQKHWKSHLQRAIFSRQISNVIMAQACVRRFLSIRTFEKRMDQVKMLQSLARGHILRRQLKSLSRSATVAQKLWRGRCARQTYLVSRQRIITLQSACRRQLARRQYERDVDSVKRCQAIVRGWKLRKQVSVERRAAETIQNLWKGYVIRNNYWKDYSRVVDVQSMIRGYLVRREMKRQTVAAVHLQRHCRGMIARRQYQEKRRSTFTIQNLWKTFRTRRAYLAEYGRVVDAQALVRGYLVRSENKRRQAAAVQLQRRCRGMIVRRQLKEMNERAFSIQNALRTLVTRKAYLRDRKRVVDVQSLVRGYLVRSENKRRQAAAVQLQRRCRGMIVRNQLKVENAAAAAVQNVWR